MECNSDKLPKVLVLTRNAWNNNNCTGNTLSNFFAGYPSDKISNAYFRAEKIENSVCKTYFNVSENELVKKVLNKNHNVGRTILFEHNDVQSKEPTKSKNQENFSFYKVFSSFRCTLLLWLRDILWGFNGWKNKNYDEFLENADPDVIYMPCYDSVYMHKILWYTAKKTGARVLLFTGDDTYTLKQFNLSPLWWINRFIYRGVMRKSVRLADTFFVISELQKKEYEKIFKRECTLLRKGGNFNKEFSPKKEKGNPLKLVYTGNIHSGRWKTLAKLAKAIEKINKDGTKLSLDIYSLSHKSKKMLASLNVENCCRTMPPASDEEIKNALNQADILVFTEPFGKREKLMWRLSFSTKIVDYLASSRAILAIGPSNLASMNFLQSNDAAFCVTNKSDLYECLKKILQNTELIEVYAKKAWQCGKEKTPAEYTKETVYNSLMKGNL